MGGGMQLFLFFDRKRILCMEVSRKRQVLQARALPNQISKTRYCALREKTEDSERYHSLLLEFLDATGSDLITIEKLSVMVGEEMTPAVFYGCLDSVKKYKATHPVRHELGLLLSLLRRHVPDLHDCLKGMYVR